MAEEKHRMLFQGQDPSQPAPNPSSLHTSFSRDSWEMPPSYEDAIVNRISMRRVSKTNTCDYRSCSRADMQVEKRRTFAADQQQFHSRLERPYSMPASDSIDAENETQLLPLADICTPKEAMPLNSNTRERRSVPLVRSGYSKLLRSLKEIAIFQFIDTVFS